MRFLVPSVIVLLAAGQAATGQSARQLYYAEDPVPVKPQPPPPEQKKQSAKGKTKSQGDQAKATPSENTRRPPAQNPPPGQADRVAPDAQVQLASATARPIGLRYSLLRIDDNGNATEISPDSTFRSGDMVGVRVEVNRDGYLYIVSRGTSGNWKLQFPSSDINGGENRILSRRAVQLPSEEVGFVFDDQPGEEQLFVVYSSEPVREIESLIYSLREPANPDSKLLAQNVTVGNSLVANLRRAGSRDLLTQRITKSSAPKGPESENAVYVVSRNSGRLVADIRLTHK